MSAKSSTLSVERAADTTLPFSKMQPIICLFI